MSRDLKFFFSETKSYNLNGFVDNVVVEEEYIEKKNNLVPYKPWFFTCLQYKSFKNTVGKGQIARNEQFLLFPQCFLPVWRTFCRFNQI